MQAYTGFAEVYDLFMDNVPYDAWEALICRKLADHGITEGLVLELGCGTGIMTERLSARGYDMIGVDLSEDMLSEAMEKRSVSGQNILYLNQDMREFELYGTVAAIVCVCDSLNYLTTKEDLIQVFRLVNNYLDPGGLFVFDFNTPAEYESPLRRHPILDEQEGITMIWENEYDPDARLNEHRLTFFLPLEVENGRVEDCDGEHEILPPQGEGEPLYVKVQEVHEQRAWTLAEIRACLQEAGLVFEAACDPEDGQAAEDHTCRFFCTAHEKGKGRA